MILKSYPSPASLLVKDLRKRDFTCQDLLVDAHGVLGMDRKIGAPGVPATVIPWIVIGAPKKPATP